jgi:hypothetical protein
MHPIVTSCKKEYQRVHDLMCGEGAQLLSMNLVGSLSQEACSVFKKHFPKTLHSI